MGESIMLDWPEEFLSTEFVFTSNDFGESTSMYMLSSSSRTIEFLSLEEACTRSALGKP